MLTVFSPAIKVLKQKCIPMKSFTYLLVCGTLLFIGCNQAPTVSDPATIIDSLSQAVWNRDLATGRAVTVAGGKSMLPEKLYAGTREEMNEDSAYFSQILNQLQNIDFNKLTAAKKIDFDLLKWTAEIRLKGTRFYAITFPLITPYATYLNSTEVAFKQASFEHTMDADHYIQLLDQYGEVQRFNLAKLKWMESRGIRLSTPEIALTIGLIKSRQVQAEQHFLYPTDVRLRKFDSATQKKYQQQARQILINKIIPQQDSLINYLQGDYLKNSSDKVGLAQYPGGKEYYQYLANYFTTTDLSPEQLHELGKQQVAKILQQIDSIRLATGFKGDRKAFYRFLQTDKRFLANTPEEVGERLKRPLKIADTAMRSLISVRPKTGYDIRRLSAALEPVMTFGNYEPPAGDEPLGIYYFNGSKLNQRPLTSAVGLALHEIIPGHHLQGRIQAENKSLSTFRQNQFIWAFSEGWASYASQLGIEMGLYKDPYDYCGRLLMDMFIAVRLVVDAGMNHMGWSREQAMQYMREHVVESDEQIKTETLRYGCDIPGQALSYKSGAMQFEMLRNKYQEKLGNKFDVIRFHDFILINGCLPFSVLEKALDRELGVAQ